MATTQAKKIINLREVKLEQRETTELVRNRNTDKKTQPAKQTKTKTQPTKSIPIKTNPPKTQQKKEQYQ